MTSDSTLLNALTTSQASPTWSEGPFIRFENLGSGGLPSATDHTGQGTGALFCNLEGTFKAANSNVWFINAGSSTVPQWQRLYINA